MILTKFYANTETVKWQTSDKSPNFNEIGQQLQHLQQV